MKQKHLSNSIIMFQKKKKIVIEKSILLIFFSASLSETSSPKSVSLKLSVSKTDMSDPLIFKLLFTQILKPQNRYICLQFTINENVFELRAFCPVGVSTWGTKENFMQSLSFFELLLVYASFLLLRKICPFVSLSNKCSPSWSCKLANWIKSVQRGY